MADSTRADATTQPERGADRNRRALATDDGLDPVLPSLDDGVTLLDVDDRGVPVLQSLALDHLMTADGPAFWVDTAGCARTTTLARVAPSWRLLERVQVARGFTAHQHHAAVADVPGAVSLAERSGDHRADACADDAGREDASDPALLVAPVVDGRYRDADDVPRPHARQLLARTLARLRRYADAYDAPVLVTRVGDGDDAFGAVVERAADHRLRCERTAQGPRFVGDDDAETLVYPQPDGTLQTTLSYWRTVLDRRAAAAGVPTADATPTADAAPAATVGGDTPGATTGTGGGAGLADAPTHGAAHERALSPWRPGP